MKLAQGWRATLCGVLAWGACLHQAGAQDAPAVQVPHELLLQFRADAPESARDAAMASVQARVVETLRPGLLRLRLPRHQPEAVVARQLMRQAAVEFAEPNLVFQAVEGVPSTERCPERLIVLLKKVGTTMIIIDEFQHFYDKASHKIQHHVADWLKTLVDRARIALVVAGLPSCMSVISQNEQLSGRFTGAIRMPRFDWQKEDERGQFASILEAFQEMLPEYQFPDLASDEMAFRFYCATGGLVGYIAKILRQAIWDALFNNRTVVDLSHLAEAYDEAVWQRSSFDSINPFSPAFNPVVTPQLLEYANSVGIAEPEDDMPQPQAVLTKVTVAEALSTRR